MSTIPPVPIPIPLLPHVEGGVDVVRQLTLESVLLPALLRALLSGVYINLFLQTITPIILGRQRKVYATILILLFAAIIIDLATYWQYTRQVMVVYDDYNEWDEFPNIGNYLDGGGVGGAASRIALLFADVILVWRCYTLWARSKQLLLMFSPFLFAEVVIIVVICIPSIDSGFALKPKDQQGIPAFYFISVAITLLATALIIYRIVSVVKENEGKGSKYSLTVEVLVESGGMYAASLVVTSILYILRGNESTVNDAQRLLAGTFWQQAILPPITGIAPTLIAFRVATGRARDEAAWSRSKPLSSLHFKKTRLETMHTDDSPDSLIIDHSENPDSQQHDAMITILERGSLVE